MLKMISYLLGTGFELICHTIFCEKSISFSYWLELIAEIEVGFRIITNLLHFASPSTFLEKIVILDLFFEQIDIILVNYGADIFFADDNSQDDSM